MRKIIRYASISWNATDWKKLAYWVDHDLDPPEWRGTRTRATPNQIQLIEDSHIMFALQATKSGSEVTITSMERESDVEHIRLQNERYVYIGNGFLYWETNDESVKV